MDVTATYRRPGSMRKAAMRCSGQISYIFHTTAGSCPLTAIRPDSLLRKWFETGDRSVQNEVINGKAVYSPYSESSPHAPISGVRLSRCAHTAGYNTPSGPLPA